MGPYRSHLLCHLLSGLVSALTLGKLQAHSVIISPMDIWVRKSPRLDLRFNMTKLNRTTPIPPRQTLPPTFPSAESSLTVIVSLLQSWIKSITMPLWTLAHLFLSSHFPCLGWSPRHNYLSPGLLIGLLTSNCPSIHFVSHLPVKLIFLLKVPSAFSWPVNKIQTPSPRIWCNLYCGL